VHSRRVLRKVNQIVSSHETSVDPPEKLKKQLEKFDFLCSAE